jgi:transcription initiation factor TFIIF subunit beta
MSNMQIKPDPAAVPSIKVESDMKDDIRQILEDEDIYEDAGDLDLSAAAQDVWLTRLPRPLWENWANLNDDEEIEIGTVRVEGPPTDIKRV